MRHARGWARWGLPAGARGSRVVLAHARGSMMHLHWRHPWGGDRHSETVMGSQTRSNGSCDQGSCTADPARGTGQPQLLPNSPSLLGQDWKQKGPSDPLAQRSQEEETSQLPLGLKPHN